VSNYISHKKAELDWIRKFCPSIDIFDHSEGVNFKFRLMKELKSENIKDLANSVTLINPLRPSYHGKKVSYRYQRQDFSIQGVPEIEVFYPGLVTKLSLAGHFTQSGQAATFGLFHQLKKYDTNLSIKCLTPKIYFETLRVLEGLSVSIDETSKIAFIDSCTATKKAKDYLEGLSLDQLIVDTTTWCLNSEEIQSIIDWAHEKNVTLYLLRSYLKLDCLGAEYGLLGSVVRLTSTYELHWDKSFLETLSYSGLLAVHENIYPFLWDKTFLELTISRTERIRSNTKFLVHHLEPFLKSINPSIRLVSFEHGLYFGVFFPRKEDLMPEKFLKLSLLHQITTRYCDSFGFDFPSLTNVLSVYEKTNESALRFCPGDNEEIKENILNLLKDYFSVFFQQI
jgi:hypothetical protein